MTKKSRQKTPLKLSSVKRIKNKYENFYKNDLGNGDFEQGLEKGMKVLNKILGDQSVFDEVVMKKYHELLDILSLKYGEDFVNECYFNFGCYLKSALNNSGKGNIRNLKLMIKYLEENK